MLALVISTAAFADPPAEFAVRGEAYSADVTHLDACVQLMERVFYLEDPASFDRAIDARQEMELAREAFHAGDAFACRRHATRALEDRS